MDAGIRAAVFRRARMVILRSFAKRGSESSRGAEWRDDKLQLVCGRKGRLGAWGAVIYAAGLHCTNGGARAKSAHGLEYPPVRVSGGSPFRGCAGRTMVERSGKA
ncbi:hypothetical protein BC628DRAFT_1090022 [Trametes gibbosa]|nr:hypothetical protein BC628DRAFT_1090022 [Trametes gibbosa]